MAERSLASGDHYEAEGRQDTVKEGRGLGVGGWEVGGGGDGVGNGGSVSGV